MKYYVILLIFILSSFLIYARGNMGTKSSSSFKEISSQEGKKIMETETNYILLDVRTKEEYDSGHIPHAILIPNETIGSKAPSQLSDKNQLIIVYCRSGNRSRQAITKLVKLGYSNLYDMGGINNWPYEIE